MFGLFKSKKDKLTAKHEKLLREAFQLSSINRRQSDLKYEEANVVKEQIDLIENASSTH